MATADFVIRRVEEADRERYLQATEDFYHSPAVLHPIPKSYIEATFEEMIRSDRYVEGWMIESPAGETMGYLLISKTFSQECGGPVVWVEELSILSKYQNAGIGTRVLEWIQAHYAESHRIRLEVEPENERAQNLYRRMGFEVLPYMQMVKEQKDI